MRLAPIVARLNAQVPALANRAVSALVADIPVAYPAALVMPLSERLHDADMAGKTHMVEARIGVELMVKHGRQSLSGGPAQDALETLRDAVSAALVGWQPDPGSGPLAFAGGGMVSFEAGLAVWRDEFEFHFFRS